MTTTSRFYTYNTTTNLYNAIIPSINNIETGKGYLIRMPNNHPTTPTSWTGNFEGVPNNGDKTVTMVNAGAGFRFNLVGNPYPSPIDMQKFANDNNTKITGALYFWRKTNGLTGSAYCTWTRTSSTTGTYVSNSNSAAVDPLKIIQTGQGFIVEASGTSTSIQFKNSQRTANTANQFFKTKENTAEISTLWLNATNDSGAFSQMAVGYNPEASLGVDLADGKYINDSSFALSSLLDNEEYVIQSRPPFDPTDEVPLVFKTPTAGIYKIAIDHTEGLFSGNQDIILKDNLTGTETNLKSSDYTFTASAVVDNARFSLKYQKTLAVDAQILDKNLVLVYKNKGSIHIKSAGSAIANVKLYDISGRLIFEKSNVKANETRIESAKFAKQILIVKITLDDKKLINKKVAN
ncbi:T9SS sorting signal type C domain-containing protein [Flavobacterium sp.]|jgi:hypothetical protein|uniref:T9SS sorting signal type C domain-containing protein n=1 Tax=Flavobacterium sp. TaxID=239 RepID=UPI0037C16045